ncbi:MAG TPA: PilZ domain-containing protein [Kofleriaceae bacterium]|nr:PilZ domain-containing protein [Kofleriaceae bacterium]
MDPLIANSHGSRLEERFPINIAVRLHWNRVVYESYTEDVSRRGLRVLTHADPAMQFLVKLELVLPGDADALVLHAMIVHVARSEQELHRRVGMRLYGIGEGDRSRWGQFVDILAQPRQATAPAHLKIVERDDRARRGSR